MTDDTGAATPTETAPTFLATIERRLDVHLDLIAAILLSIATVATAWCVYQATGWGGEQTTLYAKASSSRVESSREYSRAIQILAIDADLFLDWVDAYNVDDQRLLTFYETNLMRPSFLTYLNEWRASSPLDNPDAMPNPLVGAEYQRELFAESERLRAEAEDIFEEAAEASEIGDEYVLATVSFASVLFFAGISPKFRSTRIEMALVGMAVVMLIVGVVQIGGLPVM